MSRLLVTLIRSRHGIVQQPRIGCVRLMATRRWATGSTDIKSNMIQFLYQHKQRPLPTTEKNVVLTNCPHCVRVRKNSFAAYLDTEKGTYKCTTCHTKGSFSEFSRTLIKKLGSHEIDSIGSIHDTKQGLTRSDADIQRYVQSLKENTSLLAQVEANHGISSDTLEAFGVGTIQKDDRQYLTLPQTTLSFTDNQFKLDTVGLKLCDMDNQIVEADPPVSHKDSVEGLFGYQTASLESESIILTRREMDAMAAYQATQIPSVSIPSANYQLQESVLPLLDRFKRVYLWLDDDVEGQMAAERFARKIGDHKCFVINTRQGDKQGPLNAHDALMQHKDLKDILTKAKEFKHDQIVDFNELREDIYNEVLHPEQTRGIQSKDLPSLNQILKGHRPGELTILTGPTGSGKTTIMSQLSLDYCKSGVPTLWGSFEILNKRLAKKMLYQFAEKDLSKSPEDFDQVADQFEQLPLYFLKFFSSTAIKDVLKACHHAVYAYDIRHIILDNLQFMLSQQATHSLDKWELQDHAIAEIRRFATQQDVHITLVVHPRKDSGGQEELDIHSIFGSAKVSQEADNVVIIQKTRHDKRYLDIKKNRFDGTLGSIPYIFDKDTYKIQEVPEEPRMRRSKQTVEKIMKKAL